MGRPLNKKYFGNRNIGSTGTGDNYGIGGEGIADISAPDAGSWLATAGGAATPISGLTLPAPTLPGGVQATWTITYGIESVTTGAGKTDLILNETYTSASFPGSIIQVTGLGGANATFTVVNQGATTTLPTDLQGVLMTLRTGQGHTGAATFLVDIFTHIKGFEITEKGSGYTGTETITPALANGATGSAPVLSIVRTTDSGNVGSSTNQENAILMTAYLTGGSAVKVDIIRQVSTNRYRVTDGTRTGIVKLSSSLADAAGECSVRLVDTDGGTYFATKITARKVVITRGTGVQAAFATGTAVKWNMTAATADSLLIDNA